MPETNATYNAIVKFYKSRWESLPPFDLATICTNISMSLASGRDIELSYLDGSIGRKLKLIVVDRLDAAHALQAFSSVLLERIKAMPPAQVAALDRLQKLLNNVA
jgi:hypothetical protein